MSVYDTGVLVEWDAPNTGNRTAQTYDLYYRINGSQDNTIVTGITDTKKAMTPYFTTKKTGTGLGLPIVTKIINEHSGKFSIKNHKGKSGAFVAITLPKYA